MSRQRLRILDLDASLPDQEPVRERLADGRARRLDLSGLGSALRLWSSARDWQRLERALAEDEAASGAPFLTMIGSGDYHHVSAALIARAPGPLTVIHFDNHPDWCRCFPARHCGGWVNMALAQDHVRRVVTLGPCADDLNRPDRKGANLTALSNARLQVFAWNRPPTLTRREVADGEGHHCRNGLILWRNLAEENFRAFMTRLIETLPTRQIWITVDKDVLAADEAATNWDQGEMPLGRVVEAIRLLGERCEIVGADLCGDYAPARHRHPMKLAEAWMDQPRKEPSGGAEGARRRNARTNAVLLDALEAFA
ncbi:arginase [Aureimonas sp. D3]|uniref:arginase n=1 Tax=Aureimonas sp. D3 TaxID=1638164 RepID=UPI000B15910C|nr:arginase [Aureimonas sp. D3]